MRILLLCLLPSLAFAQRPGEIVIGEGEDTRPVDALGSSGQIRLDLTYSAGLGGGTVWTVDHGRERSDASVYGYANASFRARFEDRPLGQELQLGVHLKLGYSNYWNRGYRGWLAEAYVGPELFLANPDTRTPGLGLLVFRPLLGVKREAGETPRDPSGARFETLHQTFGVAGYELILQWFWPGHLYTREHAVDLYDGPKARVWEGWLPRITLRAFQIHDWQGRRKVKDTQGSRRLDTTAADRLDLELVGYAYRHVGYVAHQLVELDFGLGVHASWFRAAGYATVRETKSVYWVGPIAAVSCAIERRAFLTLTAVTRHELGDPERVFGAINLDVSLSF